MPEEQALQAGTATEYDVVIIDAGGVSDVFSLLSRVRKAKPQYRVVVATASPTWRRARAALHAGAADYICKSLDTERLCSSIEAVLELPPPPWSQ